MTRGNRIENNITLFTELDVTLTLLAVVAQINKLN